MHPLLLVLIAALAMFGFGAYGGAAGWYAGGGHVLAFAVAGGFMLLFFLILGLLFRK